MHLMTTSIAVVKRETLTQKNVRLMEALEAVNLDRERIEEALGNAVLMLRQEDVGWALPGQDGTYRGLGLPELIHWSGQIRASLSGNMEKAPNPHMRNGLMLRHSFVWTGGIHYADVPGSDDSNASGQKKKSPASSTRSNAPTRGRVNVQKMIDRQDNQRNFFGSSARRRREGALFTDGLYLAIGKNSDHTLRPVPLHEITDTQRSDLYQDEIIAYRWTRFEIQRGARGQVLNGGTRVEKSYWVYVDWYDGYKYPSIIYNGVREPVLRDHTAFDLHANRPEGAAFGSPDAIAALVWARIIRDLIMNGVKMQDALAMFAFKATAPTRKGQETQAYELAKAQEAGSTATLAGEQDFAALSSAGKGYEFNSIGFVVATMAASLHVSGIALSANTSLAGSSYGAAKTLDLPGQMAMETRRAEHIEFDERVLRWMGADDATAYFDSYDDSTDVYRQVQAALLMWSTGTIDTDGLREELAIIYGREISGIVPKGAINPNTETEADREAAASALVPLTTPADKGAFTAKAPAKRGAKTPKQAPAANQGKNAASGNTGHANDIPQPS